MSIRTQLLLRLIIVSIILVGGTSWLGYQDVRQETRELFDAQLVRSARLILSLAQASPGFRNIWMKVGYPSCISISKEKTMSKK